MKNYALNYNNESVQTEVKTLLYCVMEILIIDNQRVEI